MRIRKRKLVSILLAAVLLCSCIAVPAAAANFSDVAAGAWYREAVYDLVGRGVINGTSPTTFSPQKELTRAQFATMLAKTALSEGELAQYDGGGSFKDINGHWARRYINWAAEAGIINGYPDGSFKPDRLVSRQDMAVMTVNFSGATGRVMTAVKGEITFTDNGSIASYAAASVKLCQRADVIGGYKDGSFKPKGAATRAEAAVLYSNFLKKCKVSDRYDVLCKRILSTPVKSVTFDPSQFTANLAMGRDLVDGSESPSSLAARIQPVIAANAAFFDMSSYMPLGTLIKEGRVITVADRFAPAKSAFSMDSEGNFSIENFTTRHTVTLHKDDGTDSVLEAVTFNKWPSSDKDGARILFTRDWGHNLCFPAVDAVTIAEDGTILAIDHNKDVAIPETGYVLAQRSRRQFEGDFFDSCRVGDVLDVQRLYDGASTQDLRLSIGAGPRIVKDGVPCGSTESYRAEGFSDPNITVYSALRVCIGIRADGQLVIASATTTLSHLAEIMIELGCTDVVNFDGGGSSNLYVGGFWLVGPQSRRLNNILYFK